MHNALIDANREAMKIENIPDRMKKLKESESIEEFIVKTEESWSRLGCAAILYGKETTKDR